MSVRWKVPFSVLTRWSCTLGVLPGVLIHWRCALKAVPQGVGTLEGSLQRVGTLKQCAGVFSPKIIGPPSASAVGAPLCSHGSGGFLGCGSLLQALTAPNALRASHKKSFNSKCHTHRFSRTSLVARGNFASFPIQNHLSEKIFRQIHLVSGFGADRPPVGI